MEERLRSMFRLLHQQRLNGLGGTMQEYGQLQLASGSTLTQQQIDGFLLLLRQLASYRNRNSRNIGEQFKIVPCELLT